MSFRSSTGLILLGLSVSCSLVSAQDAPTDRSARDLLLHADDPAFTAGTVRMTGTRTQQSTSPSVVPTEFPFVLSLARDGRMRSETGNFNNLLLQVYDGTHFSIYSAAGNRYSESTPSKPPVPALLSVLSYGRDSSRILSAVIDRQESLNFGGVPTVCDVVSASYDGAPGSPQAKDVARTVWIARGRGIILRDIWDWSLTNPAGKIHTAFNYTSVEFDPPLADSLFVFHPPAGAASMANYGDPLAPMAPAQGVGQGGGIGSTAPVPSSQPRAKPPVVVHKVEPEYSPEARAARLQGTVLVSLDLDESGRSSHIKLIRGLGMGLDENALRAVEQWQFRPATRAGVPVAATERLDVEFRLPDGGPWRVDGSTYRPIYTAREPGRRTIAPPALRRYTSPGMATCSSQPAYVPVQMRIGPDGKPAEVHTTPAAADEMSLSAVKAVESWEFEPATANSEPIPADATIVLQCQGPVPATSIPLVGGTADLPARVGNGVSAPILIYKKEPDYSEEARKAKHQGTVLIYLVVDPEGRPSSIAVSRSLGLGLDEKALDAVAQWRFQPGRKEGKPVNVQATIQVNFKLL